MWYFFPLTEDKNFASLSVEDPEKSIFIREIYPAPKKLSQFEEVLSHFGSQQGISLAQQEALRHIDVNTFHLEDLLGASDTEIGEQGTVICTEKILPAH